MHINSYGGCGISILEGKIRDVCLDKVLIYNTDLFLPNNSENLTIQQYKYHIETKLSDIKNNDKPIILLGTACNSDYLEAYPYIDVEHAIWLNIPLDEAITELISNEITNLYKNKDKFITLSKNSDIDYIDGYLSHYFNFKRRASDWQSLYHICKSKNYTEMSEQDIIILLKINFLSLS